ncbi:hypothetical protein [Flavobacterium sp. ACN6]|uniref:hypothetical protein n=1 Tax=Flavobacterium sp. ACN6 TaxID=1920426 RepID=UPI000BB3637B|nr:hypothetical protein [Flavobacterium sp. ACN6]PBJ06102.1 hypothetical protein BSF42_41780 [Flavobacterium sp. ACN6]
MSVKKSVLEGKKNNELYIYIQPESRFVAQAIKYSFDILKQRGEIFSEEETNRILKLIEEKSLKEKQESIGEEAWDKHSVEDNNAIELFSQLSIWGFSIAFGVIFGSILLAFNLKKLNKPKVSIIVVLFGILYTVFQFLAINYLEEINFVIKRQTFLFSGVGALILHYVFWENYIGKEISYRKKSIIKPLIICIVIFIPIIYSIIIVNK